MPDATVQPRHIANYIPTKEQICIGTGTGIKRFGINGTSLLPAVWWWMKK